MHKHKKTQTIVWFMIGLIILLVFALIQKEGKAAEENTLQKQIEKQREQIEQLQKDVKKISISKASSTVPRKAAVVSIAPKPQVVQAVNYPIGCEIYKPLVAKYNWDIETAVRIMNDESGCSPTGHNWTDTHRNWQTGQIICYGSWGLFNIGCVHGYSRVYLENPANNVAVAYKIYTASKGFYPWTTY